MFEQDIVETIVRIASPNSNPRHTLTEAADGVTKSKVAFDYLGAQYEYDYALNSNRTNDVSGEVPVAAWKKKRDTSLAKLQQAFGSQANAAVKGLNAIVDKLYRGQAVRDTEADVKFRASIGMDEATWVKLMSAEWDSYYPYESPKVKAGKLSSDEKYQLYTGMQMATKAFKAIASRAASNPEFSQAVMQEYGKEMAELRKQMRAAFPLYWQ